MVGHRPEQPAEPNTLTPSRRRHERWLRCQSQNDLHPITKERPDETAEITIDPVNNYDRAHKTTGAKRMARMCPPRLDVQRQFGFRRKRCAVLLPIASSCLAVVVSVTGRA